jgi:ATP:corrinoid adenosyltransferase
MGCVCFQTGAGAGKTANALGLVLRSIGHKRKVIIFQFLKWWKNTSEYKIQKMPAPYYRSINSDAKAGWVCGTRR